MMISYLFGSASKQKPTQSIMDEFFEDPPASHVVFGSGQYHRRRANVILQNIVNNHMTQYHAQWKKMAVVQSVFDQFMDQNPQGGFVTKITSGHNIGKWTLVTDKNVILPKIRQLFRNDKPTVTTDQPHPTVASEASRIQVTSMPKHDITQIGKHKSTVTM